MPKGTCPRCGWMCYGWALLQPGKDRCSRCGARLVIETSGQSKVTRVTSREEQQHGART
jgi:uncharacterized protein (DUF983 family)